MSNEDRPEGIVLPTPQQVRALVPTLQQTDEAVSKIDAGRNAVAAEALRELALAVVGAVNEADKCYGVHNFLVKLEVLCEGPGSFRLNITDKNSDVDPQAVAEDVADTLDREGVGDYHKQARAIQMEFTNERSTAGPDGVSPGAVPGEEPT